MNYPQSYNPYQGGQLPPYANRYPQFPPNAFQPQRAEIQPLQIAVYQVSNPDEAKAQIINPMQPTMFCNFGHNEIYVKHMDNNGQGFFHTFKLVLDVTPIQGEKIEENPWLPINQRLDNIEQLLGGLQNAAVSKSPANESSPKPNAVAPASISTKSTADATGKK